MRRVLVLLLTFVLLVGAVTPAAAQSDELTQTFISEDGTIQFQYPAGWGADAQLVPQPNGDNLFVGFVASTESAAGKMGFAPGTVLEEGEVIIGITMGELGAVFNAQRNASALELLMSATDASGEEYGLAMPFSMLSSRPAARASRQTEGYDELDVSISYGEGLYAYVAIFTPPGQLSRYETLALDIAETIEHSNAAPLVVDPSGIVLSETLTFGDNQLSFNYPFRWRASASEVPAAEGRTVVVGYTASSRVAAEKIAAIQGQTLAENEVGVVFIAGDLGATYNLPPGASAGMIAEAVIERAGYQNYDMRAVTIGSNPAAQIARGTAGYQALDTIIEYGDDNFALLSLYVPPDSLRVWQSFGMSFAESFQFTPPEKTRAAALELTESFTTDNGSVTVGLPDGWLTRQGGSSTVYVATTEGALNAEFGGTFAPGDAQVLMSFWTLEELAPRLGLASDAGPLDVLTQAVASTSTEGGVTFGEPVFGELDGLPTAIVRVRASGFEGIAMVTQTEPGVFAATQLMSARGEIQQWERTFLEIVKSAEYGDR